MAESDTNADRLAEELPKMLGTAVAAGITQLLAFKSFCACVGFAAGIVGGWARPLVYRDAGERNLRAWPIAFILGWLFWAFALVGLTFASAGFGGENPAAFVPGPIAQIAVVWSVGLAVADWLAARERRRQGEFVYSKFLGWPRLAKATPAGYRWQPVILAVVGLALLLTGFDRGSGILFLGTALAFGAQLWSIGAIRNENALDQLDAKWMATYQQTAVQSLDASQEAANFGGIAQAVTTADLVRHMGTTF